MKFPEGFNPNPSQEYILKELEEYFRSGKKFAIINAPTGVGKSFIAMTLANYSKRIPEKFKNIALDYSLYSNSKAKETFLDEFKYGSYILTMTKTLQDQYENTFKDVKLMKGKNAYMCNIEPGVPADVAPCRINKETLKNCLACDKCDYYRARNESIASENSILNYAMYACLPEYLKRRHIMICDEASEIEDAIVEMFSCEINERALKAADVKVPAFTPGAKEAWLHTVHKLVEAEKKKFEEQKRKLTPSQEKKLATLVDVSSKILAVISNFNQAEFVYHEDTFKKTVTVSPLRVDTLAGQLVRTCDKTILISATIIDVEHYANSLGISKDEYHFINVESPFDAKRGPIFMCSQFNMNYKELDANLPKVLQMIKGIMKHHAGERGAIHTSTLKITKYLQENLNDPRCSYREEGVLDNQDLIELHTDKPDSVIVSPSIGFGVDLKDDLARFQIIVKLSYPSLMSTRIKKLFDSDKAWYDNKTLSHFVQTCGRVIRNVNDHGKTYVLDASAIYLVQRNKEKLPQYFLDRIH